MDIGGFGFIFIFKITMQVCYIKSNEYEYTWSNKATNIEKGIIYCFLELINKKIQPKLE